MCIPVNTWKCKLSSKCSLYIEAQCRHWLNTCNLYLLCWHVTKFHNHIFSGFEVTSNCLLLIWQITIFALVPCQRKWWNITKWHFRHAKLEKRKGQQGNQLYSLKYLHLCYSTAERNIHCELFANIIMERKCHLCHNILKCAIFDRRGIFLATICELQIGAIRKVSNWFWKLRYLWTQQDIF